MSKEKKQQKIGFDTLRLFLTYSQVPESWSKEYVLQELTEKFSYKIRTKEKARYDSKIISYIIAEELHQEPVGEGEYKRGKHYHCYLEFDKVTRIRESNYLDIDSIHGNYQSVRNKLKVINYCRKYGNYLSKGYPGIEQKELLEAKDERSVKEMLFDSMSNKDKIDFYKEINKERVKIVKTEIDAPMYAFQEVIKRYIDKDTNGIKIDKENGQERSKGLLMYGEPESGKTSFAYKLAQGMGEEVIVVRDSYELSQYYENQKVILFDEITYDKIRRDSDFYKVVISEVYARTKKYYTMKDIRYPRLVMFATNEDISKWKIDKGLQSRLIVVRTYKDGRYQYQRYNEKEELEEIEL